MPTELDELQRKIMQMEIEEAALKKEDDRLSRERLEDLQKELAEMKDRFGEPPQSVRRLLKIVKLRVNCAQRDIARIDARGNTAFIYKTGLDKVDRIVDIGDISPDRSLAILAAAVKKYPFAGK